MAGMIQSKSSSSWQVANFARILVVVLGLFFCYRLIIGSARSGYSRLYTFAAILSQQLEPADRAVELAEKDPEAHYTRALNLVNLNRLPEAVQELQMAIDLRPHHYYEWLDLGVTLDRLGDQVKAEAALKESMSLAPSFAQPHWQLGSLYYRQERYDEAFAELRRGAASNPTLIDGLIELAWATSDGDPARAESFVQPNTKRTLLHLAQFFAQQGAGGDAVRMLARADAPANEEERWWWDQALAQLISKKQLSEAYHAWSLVHPKAPQGPGVVINGSFADAIGAADFGFGWELKSVTNVTASIDTAGPTTDSRSLLYQFSGASDPASLLLSQIVLVEPRARYSLTFLARTSDLVTGGPPVVFIFDALSNSSTPVAQSKPIVSLSDQWVSYQIDFSAGNDTSAIMIGLERVPCAQNPCPAFGRLWLSRFSLAKL